MMLTVDIDTSVSAEELVSGLDDLQKLFQAVELVGEELFDEELPLDDALFPEDPCEPVADVFPDIRGKLRESGFKFGATSCKYPSDIHIAVDVNGFTNKQCLYLLQNLFQRKDTNRVLNNMVSLAATAAGRVTDFGRGIALYDGGYGIELLKEDDNK